MHPHAPQAASAADIVDPLARPPRQPNWIDLEHAFWHQRPALWAIYEAALGRLASPWAVFAACVARVLALVPPNVVLPPIVGGKGSLNWFVALAADSGGGKGAAGEIARELVPGVYTSNIGSAEGMTKLYQPDADGMQRKAVCFDVDEVDGMGAQMNRNGSAVLSMLKSAWNAKGLTLAYKTTAPKDVIGDHDYRMTYLVGVQPEKAGIILRETSGLAQRFMWFPAWDDRINEPNWLEFQDVTPAPLALPSAARDPDWRYGCELQLSDYIASDIRCARFYQEQPHGMFAREKVAYALAAMDERTQINDNDWDLSEIVSDVSDFCRAWVSDCLDWHEARESARRGRQHGVQQAVAADTRAVVAADQKQGTAIWLVRKLAAAAGPMTRSRLHQMAPSAARKANLDAAASDLADAGAIGYTGAGMFAHGSRWHLRDDTEAAAEWRKAAGV